MENVGFQKNLRMIFDKAIEIDCPKDRLRFVETECGNDLQLQKKVNRLLDAAAGSGDFLETPFDPVAQGLTDPLPASNDLAFADGPNPGDQIGPYLVRNKLGVGGFGVVYRGEHMEIGRKVAIKFLKPGMNHAHVTSRFNSEKRALAEMDHTGIARIYEVGKSDAGVPFFVMELVEGVPVNDYCDQRRLTIQQRVKLFLDICDAVQHAHERGVIHRDLKPANILVAMENDLPVPKIIDFGIAKAMTSTLESPNRTGSGQLLGTPRYMSPEQASFSNIELDVRSDIYSLGVLLFELIAGCTPTDGDHGAQRVDQTLERIRHGRIDRLKQRVNRLSHNRCLAIATLRRISPPQLAMIAGGELDQIVGKALQTDREDRHSSVMDLAQELKNYLDRRPDPHLMSTRGRPIKRTYKEYLVAFGCIAATTALVLMVLVFGSESANQFTNRTDRHAGVAQPLKLVGGPLPPAFKPLPFNTAPEAVALKTENQSDLKFMPSDDNGAGVGQSIRSLTESLEASRKTLGANHPATLEMLLKLAMEQRNVGQFEESFKQFTELLRRIDDSPAIAADDVSLKVRALCQFGAAYVDSSQLQQAASMFEQAYEIGTGKLRDDHPETIIAAIYLLNCYCRSGQLAEADKMAVATQERTLQVLGPQNAQTLRMWSTMALLHSLQGRKEKAVEACQESVASARKIFGSKNWNYASQATVIAYTYSMLEKYDEAIELSEDAIDILQACEPRRTKSELAAYETLATVYFHSKSDPVRAMELLRKAEELAREHYGIDSQQEIAIRSKISLQLIADGKLEMSIEALEQLVESCYKSLPKNHPQTLTSLKRLAWQYVASERNAEAEACFRKAFFLEKESSGADAEEVLIALRNWARQLKVLGKDRECYEAISNNYTSRDKSKRHGSTIDVELQSLKRQTHKWSPGIWKFIKEL